ncbi:glutathione S-transferase family protein [Vitiosangium sp. GDMCC 1.1324]|uniref:glutathione S-transferase family protein n=1 Tax=Vitiosangium sp. (strain GDMCC 1.1324) TaxID=2138576 RepID=UPI000D37B084|nr:glutathione S-transferase family protein [Vitiosangium sp. GDMCC 1.1324]PTL77732.1 glutathione S-transferase [Vitiosangium sp. GDMCC 1.1324]
MSQPILHHYPGSPFAEKARTMLGFKGLRWTSVIIPVIMPKPDVTALTGGYRKTPFLQIGADIYCDTTLIADVLERLAPAPTFYPPEAAGLTHIQSQWADSTLFWTVIAYTFQPAGLRSLFGNLTPEQLKAFIADRAAFRGNAPQMSVQDAVGALGLYLERLEAQLSDGRAWLLGGSASLADFSVYHPLWFLRQAAAVAGILEPHARVKAWMERVRARGHGTTDGMESQQAVEHAASSTPAPLDGEPFLELHGLTRGERVTIAATDYGMDAVEGEFVLSRPNELAIRRVDPRAGEVVVHFPRIGFRVQKVG